MTNKTTINQEFYDACTTLAHGMLSQADLTVRLLSQTHNSVFALDTQAQRYLMKVTVASVQADAHNFRDFDHLQNEIVALRYFQGQPSVHVAKLVQVATHPHPTDPDKHIKAALIERLQGEQPSPQTLTLDDARAIGRLLAHWHEATPQDAAMREQFRLKLDSDGLLGADSVYASNAENELITADQQQVMQSIAKATRAMMQDIGHDADVFGLLHGDLLLKNILLYAGQVFVLDLEYCAWGYYLYDLAPLLWQLKGANLSNYADYEAALVGGYTVVRPLIGRDLLETFIAVRHAASIRWVAKNQHLPMIGDNAAQIIAGRIEELRVFLRTGVLRRAV
jgi:Ser/Thr protein kinase RdoA (MazF antagonist)